MEKPPQQSSSPGGAGQPITEDEKRRLTEEEKKQNHIASEQKRRQAIRDGFDRLCVLVPGLEGQGRSEGIVLKRTVEFMREQLVRRRELIEAKEARGEIVKDQLKEPLRTLEHLERLDIQKAQQRAAQGLLEEDGEEDA